ncbi:MAG: helix-turn-helix domain-containing protein, partial [Lacticaseibacillus paracasei]|nr:helix-turn-helix domain-containing protein [Lacticaseibacillus paracasei]
MNIEQADQTMANIFKVLGEPHRIEILRILYHAGRELTCSEVSA